MISPARLGLARIGLTALLSVVPATAQTPPPPAAQQPAASLTFDQYKAQQYQHLQRAQGMLAQRLAAPNLSAEQRQRLERQQAQLAKFAALPPDQQEQLLRRRFDRMDTDHEGVVDAGELQAFRQAQRERAQAKRDAAGAGGKSDNFWPSPN